MGLLDILEICYPQDMGGQAFSMSLKKLNPLSRKALEYTARRKAILNLQVPNAKAPHFSALLDHIALSVVDGIDHAFQLSELERVHWALAPEAYRKQRQEMLCLMRSLSEESRTIAKEHQECPQT